MRRITVPLAVVAGLLSPGVAPAAPTAAPLVDLAPWKAGFADHVGPPARSSSRVAGDSAPAVYMAPDGQTVTVRFSKSYEPDPEIAQTYVDFLGGLPHGSELGELKVYIATPKEVKAYCGGQDGTLACYDPNAGRMTIPGEPTAQNEDGVTTSYVMTHEYGHHIANHRDNRPFPALEYGPKRWASHERVCIHAIEGRLAPGDEGADYLDNPGEGWADAYAHLKYPSVPWQFSPILEPTAASRTFALADVLEPWTKPAIKMFGGRFDPGGPRAQTFSVTLRLDGALRIALGGPAGTNFDIEVSSLGERRGRTRGRGSTDVFHIPVACREVDSERLVIRVRRIKGFGAFTVKATHAG